MGACGGFVPRAGMLKVSLALLCRVSTISCIYGSFKLTFNIVRLFRVLNVIEVPTHKIRVLLAGNLNSRVRIS